MRSLLAFLILTSCLPQPKASPEAKSVREVTQEPLAQGTQLADYVVDIFEDSKARLWFGTMSHGIACWNGDSLRYYTSSDGLPSNAVVDIYEESDGDLLLITQAGFSRFDGQSFKNTTSEDGLCDDRASAYLEDSMGRIWIGTWDGVCFFDGKVFSPLKLPTPEFMTPIYQSTQNWVTDIIEDSQGNIWFARSGYAACMYDGKDFKTYSKQDGLPSNTIQGILEDQKGRLWFSCGIAERENPNPLGRQGDGGLGMYDGMAFVKFPQEEGLSRNEIYSLYEDRSGNIWIGATGLGVYRYDGQEFKLFKGTDRMDLTSRMGIQSILEDSKGRMWFGFSGGLFTLEGDSIKNVTRESLVARN